ncbi:MAG: hypothetical protein ACLFQK_08770 [Fibrobacterota bacterium]
MNIHSVNSSGGPGEIRKKTGISKKEKTESVSRSDSVNISGKKNDAGKTDPGIMSALSHIKNLDETRPDKVAEVMEKIKNGYYSSPGFAEQLSEKIISRF